MEKLKRLDLGLETRLQSKVGLLSGGQRQALTLLMATLKKPRLLLLDEHTAALDPKTAKRVLDLTEEIIREDKYENKFYYYLLDETSAKNNDDLKTLTGIFDACKHSKPKERTAAIPTIHPINE